MFDERQGSGRGMHRVQAGPIRGVEILRCIGLKALQATLAAEVVDLPLMLGGSGRLRRIDSHAADDVGLHTVYS